MKEVRFEVGLNVPMSSGGPVQTVDAVILVCDLSTINKSISDNFSSCCDMYRSNVACIDCS